MKNHLLVGISFSILTTQPAVAQKTIVDPGPFPKVKVVPIKNLEQEAPEEEIKLDFADVDKLIAESPILPSLETMIKEGIFSKEEIEKISKLNEALEKMWDLKLKIIKKSEGLEERKLRADYQQREREEINAQLAEVNSRINGLKTSLKFWETKGQARVLEKEEKGAAQKAEIMKGDIFWDGKIQNPGNQFPKSPEIYPTKANNKEKTNLFELPGETAK